MKKLFTKSLMAVGVAGLMGLTSVAVAAEFDWYGSLRVGALYSDPDDGSDETWDLGGTGADGKLGGQSTYSRIGIKASTDLGNGSSAGLQVERGVGETLSVRHQNVWLKGGWGQLTFGQQGNPYRSAANWDQAWTLGGQVRYDDGGTRLEGIRYSSNLSGPFSFNIVATGNDNDADESVDRLIATAHYDFGVATVNFGYSGNNVGSSAVATVKAVDKVDQVDQVGVVADGADYVAPVEAVAPVDGVRSVAAGENPGKSYDNAVISVNGSAGELDWYVAYEKSSDNVTGGVAKQNAEAVGVFLGYNIGSDDYIYIEYFDAKVDNVEDDPTFTVLGYSHSLGDGVTFIAEYLTFDQQADLEEPKVLNLMLKVDF